MRTIPFLAAAALTAPPATFDPVAETSRLLATLPADQRLRSNPSRKRMRGVSGSHIRLSRSSAGSLTT